MQLVLMPGDSLPEAIGQAAGLQGAVYGIVLIAFVLFEPMGLYGRWLKIRHTGGWETGYGHLSGWAVRAGERVHQGQVVAYSGNTGRSTGPHLHYEVMEGGR